MTQLTEGRSGARVFEQHRDAGALRIKDRIAQVTLRRRLAALGTAALGVALYRIGFVYEGLMSVLVVPIIILVHPYVRKQYPWWKFWTLMLVSVPALAWLQNTGCRVGNWHYPDNNRFLLGRLTEVGEGPFGWTRWLWNGCDMPVVDCLFYFLLGYVQFGGFIAITQIAPLSWSAPRWTTRPFVIGWSLLTAVFVALPNLFGTGVVDYMWHIMAIAYALVSAAVLFSPSFRYLVRKPTLIVWASFMAGFVGLWEFVHSCVNQDYVYVAGRTLWPIYTYDGAPMPIEEPFGHIAWALAFPALLSLQRDLFGDLGRRAPDDRIWVNPAGSSDRAAEIRNEPHKEMST